MVETITLEVYNANALHLIRDLEGLGMAKIVKPKKKMEKGWAEKLIGSITPEQADEWMAEVKKMRNEWDRGF